MPQLTSNNVLSLGGAAAAPERGAANALTGGSVGNAAQGARKSPVFSLHSACAGAHAAGSGATGANAGAQHALARNFLQALNQELRAQLDPAAAPTTAGGAAKAATVAQTLPPAGKTSPQDTTQDTTQDTAAAPPDLLSIAGLPPLPVQPQAALEAATALAPARTDSTAAEQTLAGATVETLSHAAGDARAQRATPRTLLAMLEQHLGKTGPGEQLPDALRALVATTDGAAATKLAAAASVNAATAEATAGDGSPATATLTHPGADNAALPSGAATPAAALLAPADPAHAQLRTLEIEQPVAQPGWQDAVGQHVTWMVEQQVGRAELRLHPAHLGPIEVSVSVHNDEVNVSFHALHADTRDALQSSLPRLRELLGDSGLSLGQATVSQQFAGDQRSPERAPAATSVGALQFDDTGLTQEVVAAPRAIRGLLDAYA